MRRGWWVLLDNISSAPADVLERLNSLTEDEATLSLDEHFDDLVLSRVDRSINENFRLFTTADLNRIHANKLSSAFFNRVIRLSLPQIDETNELDELLSAQLRSIPGFSATTTTFGSELSAERRRAFEKLASWTTADMFTLSFYCYLISMLATPIGRERQFPSRSSSSFE